MNTNEMDKQFIKLQKGNIRLKWHSVIVLLLSGKAYCKVCFDVTEMGTIYHVNYYCIDRIDASTIIGQASRHMGLASRHTIMYYKVKQFTCIPCNTTCSVLRHAYNMCLFFI